MIREWGQVRVIAHPLDPPMRAQYWGDDLAGAIDYAEHWAARGIRLRVQLRYYTPTDWMDVQ